MKKLFILLALCCTAAGLRAQNNVGINNPNPAASAALDVTSTTQGMLVPRMTQAQRNAIAAPATGLLIYQTDNTPGFYSYSGTAWTAVAGSGGTALPSQTGNAGKVLTTDGTNLSWGSGNVSYELAVTKTSNEAQTTSIGSSLYVPDSVTFSTTNGSNAALTGGNTWNGNVFTVGSTGAGLYLVDVQLVEGANSIPLYPVLDINNTINNNGGTSFGNGYLTQGNSIYGMGINNTALPTGSKGRGHLTSVLWMSTGDLFKVRCANGSTVVGVTFNTIGNTYLRIVKLK